MSVITTRSGPGFITSVPKSYQAVTLPLMPDPVCYTTTWLDPCTLLLQFRQHYDVELVVTKFNMSLWEAMQLVRGTDVFMGMHGAGFTNLLWLQHVRAVSSNLPAFCASHLSVENHPALGRTASCDCRIVTSTAARSQCAGDALRALMRSDGTRHDGPQARI